MKAAVLALVLLLAGPSAAADPAPAATATEPAPAPTPPTHVVTDLPRLLCIPPAPSSTCRDLPPGHFVDRDSWTALDAELRRSQDAETGLKVENTSLRTSMSGWTPGWRTLLVTFALGAAAGGYVVHKL